MEEVNLYKSMFAPDLQHQTLAIIGCLIVQGPDAPVDEMECRVAAKVFKVCDSMHRPNSNRLLVIGIQKHCRPSYICEFYYGDSGTRDNKL